MMVSVVTVCYNSERTIGETIRSVCGQTHPDIEVVVVDGGSKDGTLDEVRAALDGFRGHAVVISEKDRGIYDAMRKGIAVAKGDVVGILNSDDRLDGDDVISRVVALMDSETEAVIGDVIMARADEWSKVVRYYSSARFEPRDLLSGIMPPHASFYARRALFGKLGSYRDDYAYAGDFELMVRFFLKYPLRFKHVPGIMVRMRVGGVSNSSLRNRIRLNKEILRALRENGYRRGWFSILSKVPGKIAQYFVRPTRV